MIETRLPLDNLEELDPEPTLPLSIEELNRAGDSIPQFEGIKDLTSATAGIVRNQLADQENWQGIYTIEKSRQTLPPISTVTSRQGEEFWGRRQLRPEGEGGNFNNLPYIGLGIHYVGDQAILSIPSAGYLNHAQEQYNPHGFRFVRTASKGAEATDDFLGLLAKRQFPLSSHRGIDIIGPADNYLMYCQGRDEEWRHCYRTLQGTISPYEHDLVDHAGIAAMPPEAVDTIAAIAQALRDYLTGGDPVAKLDRALDYFSYYAILPSIASSPKMAEFKDHIWQCINLALSNSISYLVQIEASQPNFRQIGWRDWWFDRAVADQHIARLQALPVASVRSLDLTTT